MTRLRPRTVRHLRRPVGELRRPGGGAAQGGVGGGGGLGRRHGLGAGPGRLLPAVRLRAVPAAEDLEPRVAALPRARAAVRHLHRGRGRGHGAHPVHQSGGH